MGVLALGATVAVNAVILILQDLSRGKNRAVRVAGFAGRCRTGYWRVCWDSFVLVSGLRAGLGCRLRSIDVSADHSGKSAVAVSHE